eukprot:m.302707 g.302707  ORF g.302707 m.302707 type:complete len:65 (+) comp16312_c1_seq5:3338-3532(+)
MNLCNAGLHIVLSTRRRPLDVPVAAAPKPNLGPSIPPQYSGEKVLSLSHDSEIGLRIQADDCWG